MTLIDPPAADWLDWLREHARCAAPAHTVILLDGAFLPGLRQRLQALGIPAMALFAHAGPATAAALELSPLLFDFDPEHPGMHQCLAASAGHPALAVLRSSAPAAVLADSLAAWCVVEIDGSAFNFRFADTRRQPAILRTLDPARRAHLLGPVVQWHCLNRQGQWQALETATDGQTPTTRATLELTQFAALVRDAEADECLAHLADSWPPAVRSIRPSQRHALAEAALCEADAAHIDSPAQRLAMVAAALQAHGGEHSGSEARD
ncbi:DUF4123 domain-containing protein [Pseudothauera lacus]|uniref:DUF4123 domain-containing protein n=1 Tax=Pseudothauera lacus TaxID=2136175 RepID=A0A2T4IB25_9RHOO|nr:DUF4123 domain-containing protein [Pseudothauera lacus]PTD94926.1 hypothetical protein C8261_17090 [Pseudothauera lacus]